MGSQQSGTAYRKGASALFDLASGDRPRYCVSGSFWLAWKFRQAFGIKCGGSAGPGQFCWGMPGLTN